MLILLSYVASCCVYDRKIEIVQFASRTRQLFVRLLALVKWMNSASKVNKCGVSLTLIAVTLAVTAAEMAVVVNGTMAVTVTVINLIIYLYLIVCRFSVVPVVIAS